MCSARACVYTGSACAYRSPSLGVCTMRGMLVVLMESDMCAGTISPRRRAVSPTAGCRPSLFTTAQTEQVLPGPGCSRCFLCIFLFFSCPGQNARGVVLPRLFPQFFSRGLGLYATRACAVCLICMPYMYAGCGGHTPAHRDVMYLCVCVGGRVCVGVCGCVCV